MHHLTLLILASLTLKIFQVFHSPVLPWIYPITIFELDLNKKYDLIISQHLEYLVPDEHVPWKHVLEAGRGPGHPKPWFTDYEKYYFRHTLQTSWVEALLIRNFQSLRKLASNNLGSKLNIRS